MKKILASIAALLLTATAALADFTGKDATGTVITFSNPGTCSSVVCVPVAQLVNASGTTLLGTAGSANAGVLSIQGIASMTPVAISQAAGSAVSGSYLSGAFASGAVVDLTAMQTPIAAGAATATKGILLGGQFDTTQKTLTNGQQGAVSLSPRGAVFVAVGADGFAVTNAGTFATQSAITAASGSIASGAVASGAFASGAVASGAYASGSLASGAVVDITNLSTPISPTTATATKGILLGMQYNSTQATFTNGQQGSVQGTSRGALYVATGADTFNVTVNAALPAGTNLLGKVGIDQTTPGTTNAISFSTIGSTAVSTGNGTTGGGSQRVTIASDNSAVSGFGVGATGSAVPANAIYNGAQGSSGLQGLIVCDSTAKYDASTSGSTQIVALSSGKTIYVCGYSLGVGGTATNVKLVYGTGTNCATSPSDITPAYQLAANGGIVDRSPFSNGLKTAASNALCVNASAANAVQALVYYAQF